MSYLYILDINLLLVISFANIFSHLVDCLLIWLMVSFAVPKVLSLIWSHLFIFGFVSFALQDRSKIYCYNLCQSVLPMFSSGSFVFSDLIFRSLSHFKFIYMYGVRKCSYFLLHVAVQLSQYHVF